MLYTAPYITCYFIFLALVLGACMGSFLNCVAWRIVHNEPVSKGRSHCDVCGHVLGIGDLIPIAGYLAHRGRCRYCGVRLSAVHVIAEAVSAVLFAAVLLNDPAKVALDDLIGGIGIAGLLLAVVLVFEKIKGIEAMGGGDIKLIFMTGIFLGWRANLLCLFLACIIGIVFGLVFRSEDGDRTFPWGPSIELAAVICMLFGNEVIEIYLGLF